MDWNASLGWILLAAFALGALHALEPGHGKSIMGAYLIASRGGVRHAVLLGVVVTITHTLVVFLLALAALTLSERFATERVTYWLEVVSGLLVLGVGVWMLWSSFGGARIGRPAVAAHRHPHDHTHPHTHDHAGHGHHHGHTHEAKLPSDRNPLGLWSLTAVGASGGLVPCPAALTAFLAALGMGRPAAGVAVVGAMSLGIASTLIAIGVLFVQAAKWATRLFDKRGVMTYAPRVSAVLITVLGTVLLARALSGSH